MIKDILVYTPMYVTFFWAVLLLASAMEKNRAKHFLGIFMVVAFMLYLSHAVFFKKNYEAYIILDPLYTFASLTVYPLYYWYIKLLTIETEYKYYNLWYLLPAFLLTMASGLVYLIMSYDEKLNYLNGVLLHKELNNVPTAVYKVQKGIYIVSRVVFAIQVIVFLILGRKLVIRYNKRIANFYSNLENKTIVWVKFLLYSFVVTSVASILFNVIGRTAFLDSTVLLFIPSAIFSVLLFFIGLQGYMQNHTVVDLIEDEDEVKETTIKDYNQTQLKKNFLELFIKEKIYKNPELKITQISARLNTNRTYISQLINNDFDCSFSEFVNEYRVLEAKKMLTSDEFSNYSLNYISEEVGFGSLNTFIRVFKDLTGVTPGRFRNENKLSSKPS